MNITAPRRGAPVNAPSSAAATQNPNAILSRYQPTGASARTASQDGLSAGVDASHRMAMNDLEGLRNYKAAFEAAGARHGLPPALLAAICSRESRAGAVLDRNGRGDGGNGFGLMQVDFRYHTPRGGPHSAEHIDQAAGILKGMLDEVKQQHPSWSPEQQLRGAVAAYNSGVDNVRTLEGMDRGTTGNDYSNDVWARAQKLAPHFGGTAGTSTGTPAGNDTKLPPFDGTYTAAPALGELSGTKMLHIGHQGESVKELQKLLGMPASAQDGMFGPSTRQAVHEFQRKHGLTPPPGKEGSVGPTTLEWLRNGGKPGTTDGFDGSTGSTGNTGSTPGTSGSKWTAAPSLNEVLTGGKVLKQGMEGASVKALQTLLGVEADGKFGPGTKAAVESFQKSAGLKTPPGLEGAVGKTTLEQLKKAGSTGSTGGVGNISAQGREQMRKLLEYAEANNTGASRGRCFEYVWRYMTSNGSGYGKIRNYNDASDMPSTYARNFAEYMNTGDNAARWGLRRLNITNPYDAPPGAIVVVAPGTPGTAHPTAGDIAIATGQNRFVNDGPNMGYGDPARFHQDGGRLLGVYVPM
jgi:peptidoglycan hydrolase-like protein with peptidoglycan-binding domain